MLSIILSLFLLAPSPSGDELASQLLDKDPIVRLKAAKLLGQLGAKGKDSLGLMRKVIADESDEDVRSVLRQAIKKVEGAHSDSQASELLDPLLNSLRTGNAASKAAALDKLAKLGAKAEPASEAIIIALVDRSKLVRERAMVALESVNPRLYTPIVTLLVEADVTKKQEALLQLTHLREAGKPSAPLLLVFLQREAYSFQLTGPVHPSWYIRCLQEMTPEGTEFNETLLAFIRPKRSPYAQNSYLFSRHEEDVRAALYPLIGSKIKKSIIDVKHAVPILTIALADEQNLIAIVKVLEEIGPEAKNAIPALKKLKLHPQMEVRVAVTDALERIDITVNNR